MTANPVTIAMNPAAWALPAGHTPQIRSHLEDQT